MIKQFLAGVLAMLMARPDAPEQTQSKRRQSRYTYTEGPMYYLGQQIVRAMQDAGYPCYIHTCYRSPEVQAQVKAEGHSNAGPFKSPHQYYLAVDIVHQTKHWKASDDFWDTLAAAARVVAEKFDVELELGYDWGWDKAHIEVKDWEQFALASWHKVPSPRQLELWFEQLLPKTWAAYRKR